MTTQGFMKIYAGNFSLKHDSEYRVLSYLPRDVCGWLCHVKAKSHAIDKEDSTYLARKGRDPFQ